ncbi:MAG: divergent polysaccharide deacetylase family protein [Campylobacteraceae bacterium]|nr:divergent polysaccharide deacetylase family protein [Campylobacteraceae bacterium]
MAPYKKKRFTSKYKKIRKKIGTKKIHIIITVALMTLLSIAVIFCIIYLLQNKTPKPHFVEQNATVSNATNETFQINQTIPPVTQKPKLAIVIDDVTFERQLNGILSIPLKITPSFLPPTAKSNFSDKLAKRTDFHMVHLPLEAVNFKSPEDGTLLVSDSYDVILQKLKKLKVQFPRAVYYNNHTGSKFTADFEAMQRLLKAMDEVGLIFVDSRTSVDTKASKVAAKYGKKLLQRDVFLDNVVEKNAIKEQILLSVAKAKRAGYAIAIGHPHKETIEALKEFAEDCDEVEVVYIKDL